MSDHYGKHDSGEWVETTGFVRRLLTDANDDSDDSRHQRFIVEVHGGQTLLIVHNIDLAKRIPVGMGDRVHFRGMYEHNDLGGLVHWTHHDPHGIEDGGWIRHRRRTYA